MKLKLLFLFMGVSFFHSSIFSFQSNFQHYLLIGVCFLLYKFLTHRRDLAMFLHLINEKIDASLFTLILQSRLLVCFENNNA